MSQTPHPMINVGDMGKKQDEDEDETCAAMLRIF